MDVSMDVCELMGAIRMSLRVVWNYFDGAYSRFQKVIKKMIRNVAHG
jgi:hypothetical protein